MTPTESLAHILMWPQGCHEEVSRRGELVPCDKTAVAARIDPEHGDAYPVCAYHSRGDMVALAELIRFAQSARGMTV